MPKTKLGEQISWKEFFARWKKGIDGVTPLQQTNIQVYSTIIMLVGIVAGIVITLFAIKSLWWLCLVLTGALGNTSVSLLGLWQKKNVLKRLYDPTDDVEDISLEPEDTFDNGLEITGMDNKDSPFQDCNKEVLI